MTDPYAGRYGDQYAQPQSGQPGYDQQANMPVPYQPAPGYAAPQPYPTVDPLTGQPLSDKSKVVAGLLGIFLGSFGAGRFYTGHTGLAIGQIGAAWGAFLVFGCLGFLFFPFWVLAYAGFFWPLIDGIILLASRSKDSQGRLLRS